MRHFVSASTLFSLACTVGLGNVVMAAEGSVDFTDYSGSSLQLFDAKVRPSNDSYVLTGRFGNNNAKSTLKIVEVWISAMDCSEFAGGAIVCEEIARQKLTSPEPIEPRTTSILNTTFHFKETPFKVTGWLAWTVSVLNVEQQ